MNRLFSAFILFCALLMSLPLAQAVEPGEVLADPNLELRAREISKGLRCVVCQNQSIDDSNAELARDLRVIVRERLVNGDSDQQVVDYVVSRYGDFVLLRPPVKGITYVLWFGPALIVIIAGVAVAAYFRRRRQASPAVPLSAEEQRRLERLLKDSH